MMPHLTWIFGLGSVIRSEMCSACLGKKLLPVSYTPTPGLEIAQTVMEKASGHAHPRDRATPGAVSTKQGWGGGSSHSHHQRPSQEPCWRLASSQKGLEWLPSLQPSPPPSSSTPTASREWMMGVSSLPDFLLTYCLAGCGSLCLWKPFVARQQQQHLQ